MDNPNDGVPQKKVTDFYPLCKYWANGRAKCDVSLFVTESYLFANVYMMWNQLRDCLAVV